MQNKFDMITKDALGNEIEIGSKYAYTTFVGDVIYTVHGIVDKFQRDGKVTIRIEKRYFFDDSGNKHYTPLNKFGKHSSIHPRRLISLKL